MQTTNRLKGNLLDLVALGAEKAVGRSCLNRLAAYLYWRTRGENLDDPDRNGEYRWLRAITAICLGPTAVAFDVGANVGDWTQRFISLSPKAQVIALEPVTGTFNALKARFEGDRRVICRPLALSDADGEAWIHVSGYLSGSNSIHKARSGDAGHSEQVTTISGATLARQYTLERIDFVKIDVEGHEMNVIRGFSDYLKERRIRYIQFEYNKTWIDSRALLRDAFEICGESGYMLFKIRQNDLIHYRAYQPSLENYCYSNWLAIAPSEFERSKSFFNICSTGKVEC